jgi:hypothetical protein
MFYSLKTKARGGLFTNYGYEPVEGPLRSRLIANVPTRPHQPLPRHIQPQQTIIPQILRSITRPGVIGQIVNQTCPHWVVVNVMDGRLKRFLIPNEPIMKPWLAQMNHVLVVDDLRRVAFHDVAEVIQGWVVAVFAISFDLVVAK